ncbi:thioesterase [Actinomadura cremea]|nr:thioesterase [Actinomadura cremea]
MSGGPNGDRSPVAEPRAGDRWFRRFHPADAAAPRLLCFPHAGGSAGSYHWLSEALSPRVATIAVQYPGRQDRHREPVHTDLRALAGLIRAELAVLGGTPAFFGHSMGALVAFEVARRLAAPPPVLFVSGRRAPTRPDPDRRHTKTDREILADVARLGGADAPLLRRPALARMALPVLRGDYRAVGTYRYLPGPALSCPIVVLAGDADPMTPLGDALAWTSFGVEGEAQVLPGGHFFLESQRERVAGIIRDRLS